MQPEDGRADTVLFASSRSSPRRRLCPSATLSLALLASTVGTAMADAPPALEWAVVVEAGYRMDIVKQSMEFEYDQWTLFKDGSAYRALPATAMEGFDAAASRRAHPKLWGRWRLSGKALETSWGDGGAAWTTHKKWFRLEPAASDKPIDGLYAVMNTRKDSAFASSSFATGWRQLHLHADGRFELGQGGSADHSSSTGQVLATQVGHSAGTYTVTGSLLTLRFEDGHTERASAFFTSSDRKTLFMNGVRYARKSAP